MNVFTNDELERFAQEGEARAAAAREMAVVQCLAEFEDRHEMAWALVDAREDVAMLRAQVRRLMDGLNARSERRGATA